MTFPEWRAIRGGAPVPWSCPARILSRYSGERRRMRVPRQRRYDHAPVAPFTALPPVLQGRRVVLEPLRAEHEAPLRRAAADERVWRYMRFDGTDVEVF